MPKSLNQRKKQGEIELFCSSGQPPRTVFSPLLVPPTLPETGLKHLWEARRRLKLLKGGVLFGRKFYTVLTSFLFLSPGFKAGEPVCPSGCPGVSFPDSSFLRNRPESRLRTPSKVRKVTHRRCTHAVYTRDSVPSWVYTGAGCTY